VTGFDAASVLHPADFQNVSRHATRMLTQRLFQDWNGAIIDTLVDPPQSTGAWAGKLSAAGRSLGPLGLTMPPVPSEDFNEWRALLTAHDLARGRFVMYEFGAGYGRWGVNGILLSRERSRGTKPAHVVFVEASVERVAALHEHLVLNGIDAADHQVHTAALATEFGTIALNGSGFGAWVGGGGPVTVPSRPMSHWLGLTDGPIDAIHMDVQSAEFSSLDTETLALMKTRVRILHVSTHGHAMGFSIEHELALVGRMKQAGWTLLDGAPADVLLNTPWGQLHTCDGWITAFNPDLDRTA
jgi:hypothetical protein